MKIFMGVLLILSSCSYSFRGALPNHLKRIYIENFSNRSYAEKDLSFQLTESIIQSFQNDNSLAQVNEENADALVSGYIESVTKTATSVSADNNQIQSDFYKITIRVFVQCKDLVENKDIVKTSISRDRIVESTLDDFALNQIYSELINEISEQILDQIIGAW